MADTDPRRDPTVIAAANAVTVARRTLKAAESQHLLALYLAAGSVERVAQLEKVSVRTVMRRLDAAGIRARDLKAGR